MVDVIEVSAVVWPLILLGLRIAVAVALYLFLFVAFRALYAELRAPRVAQQIAVPQRAEPERGDVERGVPAPVAAAMPAPAAEPSVVPRDAVPGPAPRPPRHRSLVTPLAATALLVLLGAAGIVTLARGDIGPGLPAPGGAASGPPLVEPAAGRVTVGLAAVEDSSLRVTVDGVVEFNGVLRAGQRQRWEGGERIQVWTDKGKTMLLSVNGHDLGPYSPAMGHPDWNRIDFGFWPGWEP